MVISPIYITIGRMFEQNFLFEVPKYQRYYAWESEQVSDFIKDLDGILADSEKDHFFGGIVCVSKYDSQKRRISQRIIYYGMDDYAERKTQIEHAVRRKIK